MQTRLRDYDSEKHDIFKALTVKQPFADLISEGKKTIELRTKNTSYRGKIIICSSANPKVENRMSGVTICEVDLIDVVPVDEMTEAQKNATFLDRKNIYWQKARYGWVLANSKRIMEFPVSGQLGIWNLYFEKDVLIPYPIYTSLNFKKKSKSNKRVKYSQLISLIIVIVFTLMLYGLYLYNQ